MPGTGIGPNGPLLKNSSGSRFGRDKIILLIIDDLDDSFREIHALTWNSDARYGLGITAFVSFE